MKKYILIALMAFTLIGCKSEYNQYSGDNGLFFEVKDGKEYKDTTKVSFTYMDNTIPTYKVSIVTKLIGDVVDYDRDFNIKITTKNCVVGDYQELSTTQTLTANSSIVLLDLIINRSDDLRFKEKCIDIELVDNENFTMFYKKDLSINSSEKEISRIKHTILFSEFINEKPKTWSVYHFGVFSAKKFITICNELSIPRAKFNSVSYMSYGRKHHIASKMKIFLANNPIYEDDNITKMTMGDKYTDK